MKLFKANNIAPATILSLALKQEFYHILQTENPFFNSDEKTAKLMLESPQRFFEFPLSSILNADQASAVQEETLSHFKIHFSQHKEKEIVSQALNSYLNTLNISSSLFDQINLVFDELFTNAVYNAPFAHLPKELKVQSRNDNVIEMPQGLSAKIGIGVVDNQLVLFCHDPFGSLSLPEFIQRIRDCYDRGMAEMMNMGRGGAGIGSHMVFAASTSFFAAVDPGVQTIIACSFPLKMSNKKRLELPKNVHFLGLGERIYGNIRCK